MKKFLTANRAECIIFGIAAIIYYLISSLYIGGVDDVLYCFVREAKDCNWNRPISSFSDVIASQANDYFFWNGRLVAHSIVQTLLYIPFGKTIFSLVSAIIFGLLLVGIYRTVGFIANKRVQYGLVTVVMFLIWPVFGRVMWGNVSFTVNYLWNSCMTIWLLYWFGRIDGDKIQYSRVAKVGICIVALLGGMFHEGFALPVSGMLFFFWIFNFKRIKEDKFLLIFTCLYWLGAILTATAPANFVRVPSAGSTILGFISGKIVWTIDLTLDTLVVQLYFLSLFIAWFFYKKDRRKFYRLLPYYTIALLSILFAIFIAYTAMHQLVPVALCLVVIFGTFISSISILARRQLYVCLNVASFTGLILLSTLVFHYRCQFTQLWNELHVQIRDTNSSYVDATELWACHRNIPEFVEPYVGLQEPMAHIRGFRDNLTPRPETWSKVLATHGQNPNKIKHILPCPVDTILAKVASLPKVTQHTYDFTHYYMAVVPKDSLNAITFIMARHEPSLWDRLRVLAGKSAGLPYAIEAPAYCYEDSVYYYLPLFKDPAKYSISEGIAK